MAATTQQLYLVTGALLESLSFQTIILVERRRVMRQSHLLTIVGAVFFLLYSSLAPVSSEAKVGRTYKVHGTVIAVALNQTPPLIVVKTPLGPKDHMTVGATVTGRTKILRGKKRVALKSIKEGEIVWLSYTKTTRGLVAETIRVDQ